MKQSKFSKSGYSCNVNCVPSEKGRWAYMCMITYPISGPYDDETPLNSNRTYASEEEAEQAGKAACINWVENNG